MPGKVSGADKIKCYNQLVAAGVIGYNASVNPDSDVSTTSQTPSAPLVPSQPADEHVNSCQYATSYNVVALDALPEEISVNPSTSYPQNSEVHWPTLANTACNRHMFGDAMLLDNIREVTPVWINVANAGQSSCILANRMGTARLSAINSSGSSLVVDIDNVLYSPELPANLISVI